jgi:hypothetical protein
MKNTVIYILGGTVLVGGAYLFLKNKKAKDLSKLDEIGGATTGGTTTGGTTSGGTTSSLSTTTDGVSPSDANLNLANATVLVGQRAILNATANKSCVGLSSHTFTGFGFNTSDSAGRECDAEKYIAKKKLIELDKKLATLGYKVDATGTLVKI